MLLDQDTATTGSPWVLEQAGGRKRAVTAEEEKIVV